MGGQASQAMPSPLCAPAKYRAVIFNFMGDLANCFLHTYCFRLHLSSFLSSEVLGRFIYYFKGSDLKGPIVTRLKSLSVS